MLGFLALPSSFLEISRDNSHDVCSQCSGATQFYPRISLFRNGGVSFVRLVTHGGQLGDMGNALGTRMHTGLIRELPALCSAR